MTEFTVKDNDTTNSLHVTHPGMDDVVAPGATSNAYDLSIGYHVTSPDGSAVATFANSGAAGVVVVTPQSGPGLRLSVGQSGDLTLGPTNSAGVRHGI